MGWASGSRWFHCRSESRGELGHQAGSTKINNSFNRVHNCGREHVWLSAAPSPAHLCYSDVALTLTVRRLTWSLLREAVLIHKRRNVARLREVLLIGAQFWVHVLQRPPLVAGGGRQLLLVCGVVVCRVERGGLVCRHGILHAEPQQVR